MARRARGLSGLLHALPCSHWLGASLPPSRLQRFRFINDIKAGVPRTAYQGVTIVRHNGCRKLLVASDSPLLQ